MSLETLNLSEWEQFTELWSTNATRVLEWVEAAETCLQAIQDKEFSDHLVTDIKLSKARLESAGTLLEELSTAFLATAKPPEHQVYCDRIQKEMERTESRVRLLNSQLDDLISASIINSPKQAELFLNKNIEPIPTGAPFISSLESQLRKDLWRDRDGIAVFSKIAKSNPQNYIEHYISSPGDVTTLPWDAAEKIINNFGFNTVKLQLILAAHAMNQEEPWSDSFTLSGEDIIRNLGWNNRKDIPLSQKLSELAGCALVVSQKLVGGKVDRTNLAFSSSDVYSCSV
ncbi:hypothetical protein IFO70_36985 [Phormidium tenue FACHB-886]|nr:hypothetical protein [Phormidium tenue FACHB-886]